METKGGFFQFEIIIHVFCQLFPLHLNTYVCVYDLYKYCNSFSVGTVFIRQILTYKDGPRGEIIQL